MPFDITEADSWRIITLRFQGLSIREIRKKLANKHSRGQIHRVLNYYAKYGEPPKYKQHSRPNQQKKHQLDTLAADRLEWIYEQNPCTGVAFFSVFREFWINAT